MYPLSVVALLLFYMGLIITGWILRPKVEKWVEYDYNWLTVDLDFSVLIQNLILSDE